MIACAGLCSVMAIYDSSHGVYARLGIYIIARTEVMLG